MNELPSTKFRTAYASLTQPTTVTVNGHAIGTWLPSPYSPQEFRETGRPTQTIGDAGTQTRSFRQFRPVPKPSQRK